jgi:hypothetical protein
MLRFAQDNATASFKRLKMELGASRNASKRRKKEKTTPTHYKVKGIEPGTRYGLLVVLERDYVESTNRKRAVHVCQCDCGRVKSVPAYRMMQGLVKSCGCVHGGKH